MISTPLKVTSQSALALMGALLWGLVEFLALSRSRWLTWVQRKR